MHLADVEEYKHKFEMFVSFPQDLHLKEKLQNQIEALYPEGENTSFSVGTSHGWAFFPDGDTIAKQVKDYIMWRLDCILHYEHNCNSPYESYLEHKLHEGITIQKNVEVDCFYFYDDVSRYE